METKSEYKPIENYGIIGNQHTVALVSLDGSIDYMCFPRFDSPSVFTALLDEEKGGCFSIRPLINDANHKQLYFPDTAILITRWLSEEGIAEIIDFMPVIKTEEDCSLIRKLTTIRGNIQYKIICTPRFNYARSVPEIKPTKDGILFRDPSSPIQLELVSDIELKYDDAEGFAIFTLNEGETANFVLRDVRDGKEGVSVLNEFTDASLTETKNFWKNWIATCQYKGRWREIVNRSAVTLKLLTSFKYGSVVAAATFSLPEIIGGDRNWDYRFSWTRDAAFTMYAFLRLGFTEEAAAYISWIEKLCRNQRMQVMYAVDGNTDLKEYCLDHLSGYRGSKPVRVGNAAHEQLQMDIYGELIDTIYLYNKHGGAITYMLWLEIQKQADYVCENWRKPDHGIWEIRKEEREFLSSRMMCWVALDRAIKIAEGRSFPYESERWHHCRDDIFFDIYNNFWNEEMQAYVQHKDSTEMDASVLLMPLMRLISPFDIRWKKTMAAVEKNLRSDVLIYRYRGFKEKLEGIGGNEGTFTMCSFWYVECLSKAGEKEKAMELFEKMLGYANHLGLYAEQLGMKGEHLGNFPQAFTHLALISAAFQLDKDLDRNTQKI